MKKFINKLVLFFGLVVLTDILCGLCFDFLFAHAKSGSTERIAHIAEQTNEDILIFGSSRAVHHYDATMIEKSLGKSCYNCGFDGQGILLFYGLYQMINRRYRPKVIVYDIQPNFDYLKGDNIKYLKTLRPYYWNQKIRSYISDVDKIEAVKDVSSMYRYNGIGVQTLCDLSKARVNNIKGYQPSESKMVKEPIVDDKPFVHDEKLDTVKIHYMEKLIRECKENGTKLIFVISPLYKRTNSIEYEPIRKIAKANGIPFIDNTSFFGHNTEMSYFSDAVHLTKEGASVYTERFIDQIKPFVENYK